MNIFPIKNEQDYKKAKKELNKIINSEIDSDDGKKAEVLSILIEHYETKNTPDKPTDIEYTIDYIYDIVKNTAKLENNGSLAEKGLKLNEEVGELSAELLKLTGYKHTNDSKEVALHKSLLEASDTMIMLFLIMIELGFTKQQIVEMAESQIKKWLTYIK